MTRLDGGFKPAEVARQGTTKQNLLHKKRIGIPLATYQLPQGEMKFKLAVNRGPPGRNGIRRNQESKKCPNRPLIDWTICVKTRGSL